MKAGMKRRDSESQGSLSLERQAKVPRCNAVDAASDAKVELGRRLVLVRHVAPNPNEWGNFNMYAYFVDLSLVEDNTNKVKLPAHTNTGEGVEEKEFENDLLDINSWLEYVVEDFWADAMRDKKEGEHFREWNENKFNEPYNECDLSKFRGEDTLQKLLQLCYVPDKQVFDDGPIQIESCWNICTAME